MIEAITDRFAELRAPAHWQAVEFISDLHLQAEEQNTFEAWRGYLSCPQADRPDALFILGDLFEVWVGDDVLASNDAGTASFWRECANTVRAYAQHTPVYFMAGNRDFLLGDLAATVCGMHRLGDPCVFSFLGQRWLLSHGDALCLADTDYMKFRAVVRQPTWMSDFLSRPLPERMAIARDLRNQSESRKRLSGGDPSLWADVDTEAAIEWLQRAGASAMIHGHTHRPASHELTPALSRHVLSDWDFSAKPPRGERLRVSSDGLERLPVTRA